MLIAVSLYVWGDKLDPRRITELLSVMPSDSQTKSETSRTSTNKVITAKTGMWRLSTKSEINSCVLSEHLDWLRSRFGASWTKICTLPDVEDACFKVFVGIDVEEDGSEADFELSPKNLADLQQAKIPIRFTVAFTGAHFANPSNEE